MKRALLSIVLLACAAAHAADAETGARVAAVADGASTLAAVASGVGIEANPLLSGSPAGIVALTALKLAAPSITREMSVPEKQLVLGTMTGMWAGAAANNIALLAGATGPAAIVIGISVGIWRWSAARQQVLYDSGPIQEPGAVLAGQPAAEVTP